MKSLVIYYSRSGRTKAVAEFVAHALGGELEEIVETGVNRRGFMGFLRSGRAAKKGEKSPIEPPKRRPQDFDLTVVGSPVWAGSLVPAVRSYLSSVDLKGKPVALFCTLGGRGSERTLASMKELASGARLVGELSVSQREFRDRTALGARVGDWVEGVRTKLQS